MSPVRNQLVNLIDCMPEQEQQFLFEIVRRFALDDDVATFEDLADIKQANEEFEHGEFVKHEDINWK